ncbi:hypothetical protein ACIREE_06445 [Streptomyces sp. NPDC102467]|uniref:hypothetical protein n=1 Tax=Streptomyces sp. NPDC102467 TaxID=3366179 RepID=UPI0037FB6142
MNGPDTDAAVELRGAFATDVVADSDSPWHTAFALVPRHVFVPRFEEQRAGGSWHPIQWGEPGYLERAYSDAALTTQLDEHGVPSSSSSQPSVMRAGPSSP